MSSAPGGLPELTPEEWEAVRRVREAKFPGPMPPPVQPNDWMTPEFWVTVAKMALTVAVLGGWLAPGDRATVEGNVVNGVLGAFMVASNAVVVWRFFHGQTEKAKARMAMYERRS